MSMRRRPEGRGARRAPPAGIRHRILAMIRPGAFVVVLAVLGLSLSLAVAAAPAAPGDRLVRLEGPSGPVLLPALERNGRRYVSLRALALALGREARHDPRGDWRIETGGGTTVRFPASLPGMAWVGRQIVSLGGDALREGEDLLVPVSGLERLVRALEPAARVTEGGAVAVEGEPGVRVLLLGRGPGRLDVRVEFPPPARSILLRRGTDGSAWLQVAGIDPGTLPWSHREIGGHLLEAMDLRSRAGGLELVVRPGPGLQSITLDRDETAGWAELHLSGREPAGEARDPSRNWLVVLDPGHGGEEEGAVGPTGVVEKDLVLDVARRTAALLRAAGFEVELTRDGDENVSLDDRAALANRLHADLFVSIHANASPARSAHGAETYILAREATDDAARATAALENDAGGVLTGAGGRQDVGLILWDLAQVEYLEESARLAETIQDRLDAELGLDDRGVKQAPFRVLVGATCPAVLVELGFLTNPQEERLLATAAYRRRLARVLAEAVIAFRDEARAAGEVAGGAGEAGAP